MCNKAILVSFVESTVSGRIEIHHNIAISRVTYPSNPLQQEYTGDGKN